MNKTRSASGLSLRSQTLYWLVYVTRYLDLFHITLSFLSIYNFVMKCLFIGAQSYLLYTMVVRLRSTIGEAAMQSDQRLPMYWLVGGCMIAAALFNSWQWEHGLLWVFREYWWTFSIMLEAIAILPQLFLLQTTGESETINTHYLFCLGGYRALYILNWIYRWFYGHPAETVVILPGLVQTALYSDFFYVYWTRVLQGKRFKLPV